MSRPSLIAAAILRDDASGVAASPVVPITTMGTFPALLTSTCGIEGTGHSVQL